MVYPLAHVPVHLSVEVPRAHRLRRGPSSGTPLCRPTPGSPSSYVGRGVGTGTGRGGGRRGARAGRARGTVALREGVLLFVVVLLLLRPPLLVEPTLFPPPPPSLGPSLDYGLDSGPEVGEGWVEVRVGSRSVRATVTVATV